MNSKIENVFVGSEPPTAFGMVFLTFVDERFADFDLQRMDEWEDLDDGVTPG